MTQVSLQILNVSLSQLIVNYSVEAMLLESERSRQEVPFCRLWASKNPLVTCTDPLASVHAPHSLLWEMGLPHLPKLSGQNLWEFGLGAGAAPVCVDPTPLESPSMSQGSRNALKSPGPRCCKPTCPKAAMWKPDEKAKDKIAISSNIYFKPLDFRWPEY